MKYKAVIFDLDGTLVNTLTDIANSANYAMEQLSQPSFPVESFRLKVGSGNKNLISDCLSADKQHLKDRAIELQLAYYAEHFHDNSDAYPGVMDMLRKLGENGLKLAVLSNKPASFVSKLVKHVFGGDCFEVAIGEQANVPLKPDPTSSLAIADKLGAAPQQIAFVGDSASDMQTALNAGMFAVGVTWGFRGREELIQNGSEALIDHPDELLPLLSNENSVKKKKCPL